MEANMTKKDLFSFIKNTINNNCTRKFILKVFRFADKNQAENIGKKTEYLCLVDYAYKDNEFGSVVFEDIIDINNQPQKPPKVERIFESAVIVLDKVTYSSAKKCKNVIIKKDKQINSIVHDNLVLGHTEVLNRISKLNMDEKIQELLVCHYKNRYGLNEKDIKKLQNSESDSKFGDEFL